MWTLANTATLGGTGVVSVTPDLVTTYEGGQETAAVVHQPVNGPPVVTVPGGITRARARTGTWVLLFGTWAAAREALELLAGYRSDTVFLHREDGYLEVLPTRHRHRVLAGDDLDMHEVTVEWLQLGGVY